MYSEKLMKLFRNPHNMGSIKDADGVGKVGNPKCLLPETKVHTIAEIKPISDIKMDDMVLGHDGRYHKVKRVMKRKYKGKILKIKNRFGITFLTPEHEIMSVKIPKKHYYNYTRNKKKNIHDWNHAEELEAGDMILYPISKDSKNISKMHVENRKLRFDYRSRNIPKNLLIDDRFLRLSGYYLAEGSVRDKITKTDLSFAFNIKEEKYVNDVILLIKDIFDLDAKKKIEPKHNTIIVNVNSVMVVRLFKNLFGTGAENKRIPEFMMLLSPKKQKALIQGLWRGDGYFSTDRKWPRAGYSTISYELCQQLKLLLLRQGIIPSIYEEKEKIVKSTRHRKSYRIHIGSRDSMKILSKILDIKYHNKLEERNDTWIDEEFAYVPINEISKTNYNGYVYNLEVDDARSFTTDSFLVHNCGDVMYLYIKVKNNKIADIKFETFGCAAAIATSSIITDLVKGRTINYALKLTKEDIIKKIGGLPPLKIHCSLLAIDALHAAIKDYKNRKGDVKDKKKECKKRKAK